MMLYARAKSFLFGDAGQGAYLASTAVIARMLQQATAFLLVVFAASFLQPAEFGIYTLAVAFVLLLQTITYTGVYDFLIAEKGDDTVIKATTFWLMIGISAVGALALFLAAPVAAWAFDSPDLLEPLRWLALNQPLTAAVAWISAVLLRENKLGTHYNIMILQNLIALAVGIVLLMTWQSIWALVVHRYARSVAGVVLYYGWCRVAPGLRLSPRLARKALHYASGLYGARLLTYLSQNAAVFVLGLALSPALLGIFRFGERIAMAALSVLTEPMRSFAITRFGTATRESRSPFPDFNHFLPTMIIVIGCAAAGIAVFAEPVIEQFFLPSYGPAGPIAVAIAVAVLLSLGQLMIDPLLAAIGRTGVLFSFQLVAVIVGVLVLLATVPFGVEAVAWGRAATALGASLAALALMRRFAAGEAVAPPRRILMALGMVIAFAALAFAGLYVARHILADDLLVLLVAGSFAAAAALAILLVSARAGIFLLHIFTDRPDPREREAAKSQARGQDMQGGGKRSEGSA